MYTQLGVLYAKYKEDKLMEHIKLFWSRLNIPTLLVACQQNLHWNEAVFLYTHYDQYDNAIDVLMQHPSSYTEKLFKETILHVPTLEKYFEAIDFYVEEHPLQLNDLLLELAAKLDHTRVVALMRKRGHLPLIDKYLLHVQHDNNQAVNEAVNELWVNEEKYKELRQSIDSYNKFDQIALAQQVEKHQLLEFRRIAAYLYRINQRWDESVKLSKQDRLWGDAMEAVAESKSQDLAEELVYYFVNNGLKECFAACLCTCYDLIRPDVVLEVSWRNGLNDYAMPYMIQSFRNFSERLATVQSKLEAAEKAMHDADAKEKKAGEHASDAASFAPHPALMITHLPLSSGTAPFGVPVPPMGFAPQPPPGAGFF